MSMISAQKYLSPAINEAFGTRRLSEERTRTEEGRSHELQRSTTPPSCFTPQIGRDGSLGTADTPEPTPTDVDPVTGLRNQTNSHVTIPRTGMEVSGPKIGLGAP